jgi:hypothetical protein
MGTYLCRWGKAKGKETSSKVKKRTDNITNELKEIEYVGVDWMCLSQHSERCRAVVNALMNFRFP